MAALPDDLVMSLRVRAGDPNRFVDRRLDGQRRCPPVADVELRSVERRLGFALPEQLTDLYRRVGNGGFGPGYGVLGIGSGARDDLGQTVDSLYESFSASDPDDPSWRWRRGVLPFCYWGCVVYSCVDADGMVIGFDEGRWVDDGVLCESWLRAWLDGNLSQPTAHR